MPRIAYNVTATFSDQAGRERYLAWLTPGHVGQVLAGGASSAQVIAIDHDDAGGGLKVEARYVFVSREALERYFTVHAPALRADGLKHFGPETGVIFARSVGEIVD